MGEEEKIEIPVVVIKSLILAIEPNPFSQAILQLEGLGSIIQSIVYGDTTWSWNIDKVNRLNNEELIKLLKELAWR